MRKHAKDLIGLLLKVDEHAVLAQFARSQIELERRETITAGVLNRGRYRGVPPPTTCPACYQPKHAE